MPSIKWYHIVTSLLEAPKGKIKEIEAVAQMVPPVKAVKLNFALLFVKARSRRK